ncbi:MAG TPA: GWxTD domain-containing protein [Gemmatimonadales bacterium]
MKPQFAGTLIALVLLAARLPAQTIAAGDSALARGDTSKAIEVFESATRRHLDDAEAHYRAGVLLMTRHHPGDEVSAPRRRAEEHFRYAMRFQPDSAKYYLGLADAFRGETEVTVRAQVIGLLTRAAEVMRLHGGSEAPTVLYRAAAAHWEQYETYANHIMMDVQIDDSTAMADPDYANRLIAERGHPTPGAGEMYLASAEDELRGAVSAGPGFVPAAGLLVVLLGEQSRWAEAVDAGRHLVRAAKDSGRAWAILGLAFARANRWRESQSAFDSALKKMTPAERAPYDNLGAILRQGDAQRFQALQNGQQAGMSRVYWDAAQPLFLTERNETRTEFFARITYVIHRWSDRFRGYQGYQTDRGAVYVRYGPPDLMTSQRGETSATDLENVGKISLMWIYRTPPMRFMFSMNPGYAKADFGGDFREMYRDDVNEHPVSFSNVPAVKDLDTVDVQVAQFRSDTASRTDVAVFGLVPLGRMMRNAARLDLDLQMAAIVKDSALADVARLRQDARIRGGDTVQVERRLWRMSLPHAALLLRVEANVPVLERAARGSAPLDVRSFSGDTLMMSDVVLAGNLVPRDSNPSRWTDFFLEPSSGRLAPNQPVGLLWEIYNLVPDSLGVVRYHVEIRVKVNSIERHGIFAEILGGIGDAVGLTARGDNAASLGYNRQANGARGGRQLEYLKLNLRDAPNAEYEVGVAITDSATNRTVYEFRRLVVTPTPLRR